MSTNKSDTTANITIDNNIIDNTNIFKFGSGITKECSRGRREKQQAIKFIDTVPYIKQNFFQAKEVSRKTKLTIKQFSERC